MIKRNEISSILIVFEFIEQKIELNFKKYHKMCRNANKFALRF